MSRACSLILTKFQSTLSVRRATDNTSTNDEHRSISIHALRKESDARPTTTHAIPNIISIHALRKESDDKSYGHEQFHVLISIHALRKESDHGLDVKVLHGDEFQSTLSVRRATPARSRSARFLWIFQSTLSVRRATTA